MKIKVGNKIFSGLKVPVMVMLTKKDKWNIAHMVPGAIKYAQFPYGIPEEEIVEFMKTGRK